MAKIFLNILLLLVTSCSTPPVSNITYTMPAGILSFDQDYVKVYKLLSRKMMLCYDQVKGSYHMMGEGRPEQKTYKIFDKKKRLGVIYYQRKTEFKNDVLFYIEVRPRGPESTVVTLWGKGRRIRTSTELNQNIKLWANGKKAYCVGKGRY